MTDVLPLQTISLADARNLGPWTEGWGAGDSVPLQPTPLDAQPSAYVQESWRERPYGQTAEAIVQFIRTPETVYARVEWACPSPRFGITDNDVFADACAILFPANGHAAPLATLGDKSEPVVAWHWRAGAETAFIADGTGLGTLSRRPKHDLNVAAEWRHDRWAVVFTYPLTNNGHSASPAASDLAAFAVWSGANQERAGLAACSPAWRRLRQEATAGGAR
jgi:DMSO reductase family type II enzyme heme b subunit